MIRTSLVLLTVTSTLVLPITAASKPAPDVTLSAASGGTVRMADLKGKVVLVDFWASWCVPCRASFPALDALNRELQPKGFMVLAVNVDEQEKSARTFMEKHPHTMTVTFDPRGTAARAFDVQGMPSSMIVDRAGRIRFTHMGYSESTIRQFRAEVLQLLSEGE